MSYVKDYLEQAYNFRKDLVASGVYKSGDWKYICQEDFILHHGRQQELIAKPKGLRMGAAKACYNNACLAALADDRYLYTEGYALGVIPVQHAWLTPVSDLTKCIDITWTKKQQGDHKNKYGGPDYLGVIFKSEYVKKALLRSWYPGVIDAWQDGWPLLTGKDSIEEALHESCLDVVAS